MSHKTHDNPNPPSSATPITLDQVFKAMQHWRKHKREYPKPGIPTDVWKMIFQLEETGYAAKELKGIFNINSDQYDKKRHQLSQASDEAVPPTKKKPTELANDDVEFCEATVDDNPAPNIPSLTISAAQTKKDVAHLKSTRNEPEDYLDLTTIIVECIRPDGHRLNIHTTTKSLDKVMQAFFEHGVAYND